MNDTQHHSLMRAVEQAVERATDRKLAALRRADGSAGKIILAALINFIAGVIIGAAGCALLG